MTRGRITFHLSMQGIWDPELGLISQKATILVAGRHIGRDTTWSPIGVAGLTRRKSSVGDWVGSRGDQGLR
jgi:hypothetical protein